MSGDENLTQAAAALRASVEALRAVDPEAQIVAPWIADGAEVCAKPGPHGLTYVIANCDVSTEPEDEAVPAAFAGHIALTASPAVVLAIADLLDELNAVRGLLAGQRGRPVLAAVDTLAVGITGKE